MKEIKIKLKFIEEALGTSPANEDIYKEYIGSKAEDALSVEEEVAALGVDEVVDKSMTVFPKLADGTPFIYDYQIRGFLKEMCGIIKNIPETESSKIKANKKLIDNYIFVTPRQIPLDMHGGRMGVCQRPLRASTMQGERIALAISETVPEGTTCEFIVTLTAEEKKGKSESVKYEDALKEWLDYGKLKGFGQWRNSGKGRFEYEIIS